MDEKCSHGELQIKVAKLEEKLLGHENRIETIEKDVDILPRLTVLMETLTETNKELKVQTAEQHTTLTKINENLDNMNHELKKVSKRVDTIEEERMDEKLRQLQDEKKVYEEKEKERKKNVTKVLTGVITTVLGAALLLWLGLK